MAIAAPSSSSSTPQVFNPRLVVGIIVAGIVAFGALMLLLAFGDRIGSGRTGRANALSVSAVGYKGLVDLTGRLRHSYLIRNREEYDASNLIVVALEPGSREADLRALLEARADKPTLIILPKWMTERDRRRRGWVRGVYAGLGERAARDAGWPVQVRTLEPTRGGGRAVEGEDVLAGLRFAVPRSAQVIQGRELRALVPYSSHSSPSLLGEGDRPKAGGPDLSESRRAPPPRFARSPSPANAGEDAPPPRFARSPSPSKLGEDLPVIVPVPAPVPDAKPSGGGEMSAPALIAQLGDRPHYVLADPDLLNNHGLREPARARAAVDLLDRLNAPGDRAVGFDLTMNGYGSGEGRSMLRMAFEPPFLAMTLALFVAALLAGLHGAFRFGPARREERAIAFGKAALVENSAGLIRLAGREARLGGAYADVMRQEMARAAAAPGHLQGAELDLYLNRLGAKKGVSFSELAGDLWAARDRHSLMDAVRRVWAWRKNILR